MDLSIETERSLLSFGMLKDQNVSTKTNQPNTPDKAAAAKWLKTKKTRFNNQSFDVILPTTVHFRSSKICKTKMEGERESPEQ